MRSTDQLMRVESDLLEVAVVDRRAYHRITIALFVAGLATFALIYSTQALLPALSADFGVDVGASTLTVSLTTLGLGAALLVVGPASDVLGRTRFIHASLVLSAIAATACAVAPGWSALLVLRLLEGVALAGLPAVATAYLREEMPARLLGRAAGVYVGGTALGGMVGRLVTGGVAEVAGWRWALAAIAAVALVASAVVLVLLPRSTGFESAPSDARAVLSRFRGALGDPALLMLYAVGACGVGSLVAVFNVVGFRLEAAPFGLGPGLASLVFCVYPLGSVASVVAGRLVDRVGRRPVLPIGALVAVAGTLMTLAPGLPLVVTGIALLTTGFFALHAVASSWVPARAHARGIASGQAASLYLVAYYLGSSVFGSIAGHAWTSHGWGGVVALATGLLLVCAALAAALSRTRRLAGRAPADASVA